MLLVLLVLLHSLLRMPMCKQVPLAVLVVVLLQQQQPLMQLRCCHSES